MNWHQCNICVLKNDSFSKADKQWLHQTICLPDLLVLAVELQPAIQVVKS